MDEDTIQEYTDVTSVDCKEKPAYGGSGEYYTCTVHFIDHKDTERSVDLMDDAVKYSNNTELNAQQAKELGGIDNVEIKPSALNLSEGIDMDMPHLTPRSVRLRSDGGSVSGLDEGTTCKLKGTRKKGYLLPYALECE